jgi:hypothetical protein
MSIERYSSIQVNSDFSVEVNKPSSGLINMPEAVFYKPNIYCF